ncbi:MAG: hypothetical protein A3E82_06525 [Gammaproteobacteria bacterium RIFCSPHIGHO2_12_FULL_38_11]|nr:MAG: hypothetical protein A3E82_06525 [Gammaproteobacteria bacterium RIFCSPHIGHO2_12_FULL_38_11]
MSTDVTVYLDESGDLGWKFDKPYRQGGSSRYLTISAVLVPKHKNHFPGRVIKRLYQKFEWQKSVEQKWTSMNNTQKDFFCAKSIELINNPQDSSMNKGVQYADMLCGMIQQHFEDQCGERFKKIEKSIKIKKLFFI